MWPLPGSGFHAAPRSKRLMGEKYMSLIRSFLARTGFAERRKDQRVDAKGLPVSCAVGSQPKSARVGNISPTGLYLFTEERWAQGTIVVLTLGEKSRFDKTSRSVVQLWTRCIRTDDDGAGLTFTHAHINRTKWLEAMSLAPSLIAENHPVHVFRFTRALAFLFSTSPASQPQLLRLLQENPDRENVERAIEIALLADDLLESQSCASRMDVPPALVLRILAMAMEIEQAEAREYWARLLAASALSGSHDDSSLAHLKLLSSLNLYHLRVLTAAWHKTDSGLVEAGLASAHNSSSTTAEIAEIAGLEELEAVESIVNDLHEFGLLENSANPDFPARLAPLNLTLSGLGLRFCERCCSQLKPSQEEILFTDPIEQYVPLDFDDAAKQFATSLVADAQSLRQSSSLALID